jgi:hypothetical protein
MGGAKLEQSKQAIIQVCSNRKWQLSLVYE